MGVATHFFKIINLEFLQKCLRQNADVSIFVKNLFPNFLRIRLYIYRKANTFNSAFCVSVSPPLVQLQYSLNSLYNRVEQACHFLFITQNVGVTTRFLKLLIFFENFNGACYIFPVTSPVSRIICSSRTCFARALRHQQVHVYS